jgi:two-component system, OmpR family, sensor kinase
VSLRRRLLLSVLVVVVVLAIGVVAVVRTQRTYLVRQVDQQLEIIRPTIADQPSGGALSNAGVTIGSAQADFYLATRRADGTVSALSGAVLPLVVPDLAKVDSAALVPGKTFTVRAVGSAARFRIMSIAQTPDGSWLVAGLPLGNIDRAQRKLVLSLIALAAVIGVSVILAAWWVVRLGLRPIEQLTRISESIVRGDRSRRSLHTEANTESGKLGRAFNLMLDERDEGEQQLRRFVADASHELRTPLTSIRGFLDAFANGRFASDIERADAMRRMNREVARMHHLVQDLLLLADLDQERPLHRTTFDLRRVVTDVAGDAIALHPSRRIESGGGEQEPINVSADLMRVQQVVVAVMHNAVTHTFADTTICVGTRREQAAAVVTIRDDGPGIDAKDLARVFERFYRTDASRTRRVGGGSGLGLAIAQAVINAHGGEISVESSPGAGCTFTIRLPLG